MSTWNERPKDLKPEELNAWALCEMADAIYNIEAGLNEASKRTAEALAAIADNYSVSVSLDDVAKALHELGKGTGSQTQMGAIEFLAYQIKEGLNNLTEAIELRRLTQHDD